MKKKYYKCPVKNCPYPHTKNGFSLDTITGKKIKLTPSQK